MKIKNLYTSSHKHATILLQQNCSLKYFIKIKIEFAQCCFRAYLLMFQNDWKDFTLVQRRFWGTNCDLGVSLSRRNISQFSFFSLHTERIKMRWLLSESVLCLQRGDWETLFKQKSCMAQNGWYSTVNKLQLEVRNGFLSKNGSHLDDEV